MIATTAMTDAQLDRIAHDRFLAAMDGIRRGDSEPFVAYMMGSAPPATFGRQVWISDVKTEVALFYVVGEAELEGRDRDARIVRIRNVAMYLARKLTGRSLAQIARAFGNRDHTTVLNGIRRIEAQRTADDRLDAELTALARVFGRTLS